MRTIIAPVNFTPNSQSAAMYAADMASATAAELLLLHVLQLPVSSAEFPASGYVFSEMRDSGEEALQQLQEDLGKRTEGKIKIYHRLEVGGIEAKIEELCREKNPFVVVMGTSGHLRGTAGAGNDVTAAIHNLNYPLIIVPQGTVFRWIRKLVLACDLDDISTGVSMSPIFLKELRDLFHSRLEVINVNTKKQERVVGAVIDIDMWKSYLHEIFPEVHIVDMDNVQLGVDSFLLEHEADMLIVFPKRHNFFSFHRSQAKQLALTGTIPIMSIHC
jgi:nucleotide-binding universal stress UspA family protein